MVALWMLKAVIELQFVLTTTESFCEAHTTNCRLSLSSFSLAVSEGLLNKGSPLSAQDNPVPGNPVPGGAWAKLAERFV